jgi:hypothetical protein
MYNTVTSTAVAILFIMNRVSLWISERNASQPAWPVLLAFGQYLAIYAYTFSTSR